MEVYSSLLKTGPREQKGGKKQKEKQKVPFFLSKRTSQEEKGERNQIKELV